MTSKNETGAFIKYFGNSKSQLTEGETIVREILKELGFGYRLQEPITVSAVSYGAEGEPSTKVSVMTSPMESPRRHETLAALTFTIDLFIPEHKICVEVDGIHHRTAKQERKTAWRDAQLIANGYRVLHIDAAYTETKELQAQLKPLIQKAIKELIAGEQTKRIVA